ncbi:MAG: RnfH family protein [Betaproteobacteria bacterium]|nr:RnfH family protein [Betaproteobacteria bacterium]
MGAGEAIDAFDVEVVYALPDRQRRITVRVAAGASVAEAIRQSGILDEYAEIDPTRWKLGIFSRRVAPDSKVRAGDRIEIYRPLVADPKTVRRERARSRKG